MKHLILLCVLLSGCADCVILQPAKYKEFMLECAKHQEFGICNKNAEYLGFVGGGGLQVCTINDK